jgi:NAD(P)H-hydrate epimerase
LQRILTAAQMREVDRVTIEERGIPGLILMENAGARVYELLAHRFSPLNSQRIVILCGKGNNGGDGLVVARHIITRGNSAGLSAVLLADGADLKGDAEANYRMLRAVGGEVLCVRNAAEWRARRAELLDATIVVDAMLGTGLRGPAEGLPLELIRDVNSNFRRASVVAVDMPSGLPSDDGEPWGESIRADYTVTFTAPKVSQILAPNHLQVGKLIVVPIGTAPSIVDSNVEHNLLLIDPADVAPLFAPRPIESHKGDFGHVLVIGGSRSKPGAVLMAGSAALRSGAGLVTVATAATAAPIVVGHTPELMTEPAAELDDGSIGEQSFSPAWLERKTVVAIGPGIGTRPENAALVRRVVQECAVPVVVDADALAPLGTEGPDWNAAGKTLILTPHPGEMACLTGQSIREIQRRRVETARRYAEEHGVIVVLKGHRTLVAAPDGRVFVNTTGTPAMATGGSGDILTGMIAGLLAQHPATAAELTVAAAVYLHGLAAEKAAKTLGECTTLATDILGHLPAAIASLCEC